LKSPGRGLTFPAVATAGNVSPRPGLFNVVPGACELWLEVRHTDAAILAAMERELQRRCAEIAGRREVKVAFEEASRQDPTPLSPALVAAAEPLARELGLSYRRMASGAAHDAMEFARASVPALMVFVPSRGGVSHSPEEFTAPAPLFAGYRFTRELARRLSASWAG